MSSINKCYYILIYMLGIQSYGVYNMLYINVQCTIYSVYLYVRIHVILCILYSILF